LSLRKSQKGTDTGEGGAVNLIPPIGEDLIYIESFAEKTGERPGGRGKRSGGDSKEKFSLKSNR